MIEPTVPIVRFFAWVAWSFVGMFVAAGWIVLSLGHPDVATMLGFTGCATSAVAAVLTIRVYVTRVCRLIRLLHADDLPPGDGRGAIPLRG